MQNLQFDQMGFNSDPKKPSKKPGKPFQVAPLKKDHLKEATFRTIEIETLPIDTQFLIQDKHGPMAVVRYIKEPQPDTKNKNVWFKGSGLYENATLELFHSFDEKGLKLLEGYSWLPIK